jgi:hypothetical protein
LNPPLKWGVYIYTIMKDLIKKILLEDRMKKGFWNQETLRQEALKYTRLSDFSKFNQYAFNQAKKLGKDFFEEITAHMPRPRSLRPYTDQELIDIASQYGTKKDFMQNDNGAYQVAFRRGGDFYQSITSHMKKLGSKHKRMVYGYFFPKSNATYIGLTLNIDDRNLHHIQGDKNLTSVRKYILQTGEIPRLVKFTDYIDVDEAALKEIELINKIRDRGYVVLNKVKGGGLGHGLKYSDEDLEKIASNYNNIKDFYTLNLPAHKAARNRGNEFFKRITAHMVRNQIDWSKELVIDLAKNFDSKSAFSEKYPGGRLYAKNIGIWDDLFPQEIPPSDEEIIAVAVEFDTQNDFRIAHPQLYTQAYNQGLLPNIMFKKSKKKSATLTDDDIIRRAKEYQTFKEFYTYDNTAYRAAKRRGDDFYKQVTSHMIR